MRQLIAIILSLCLVFPAFALESLTEIEYRRDNRKTSNTFYSGEDSENYYIWQPQTVIYTDITTGHEVTVFTNNNNLNALTNHEYGGQMWSADGKRIMYQLDAPMIAYTRSGTTRDYPWMVALSDGSYLRPTINVASRGSKEKYYSDWSPIDPDIFYSFGDNSNGLTGLDENMLYKHVVSNTTISRAAFLDFISENTGTEIRSFKDNFTPDGLYFVGMGRMKAEPIYVGDMATPEIDLSYNLPTYDSNWGGTTGSETNFHDEMLVGSSAGYWLYGLPGASATWWRQRLWGTDNAAPNHTSDTTSPYDWWTGTDAQKEVQPLNASSGTVPDFAGNYWSHAVFDRWGVYASYSDTNGAYVGAGVWDIKNSTRTAFPASDDSGTQYHAWNGWSDYTVHTLGNGGATSDWIGIQKYDGGTDLIYLSDGHWFETPNENTKPAQSPDGTKVGYRSDWLITSSARSGDSGYSTSDLHIVTAYYPFPPEIISVTSGVVRFGWETDVVSRGYTERGWPDESTDDPPPPRETKEFRLWKSTNGTTGWIPVGTVTASIFDRYNFATGIWSGLDYWEITDPSPSGYYAVTSIEHSGLESRTLSNVFSAAGSQTAAYPAFPGS